MKHTVEVRNKQCLQYSGKSLSFSHENRTVNGHFDWSISEHQSVNPSQEVISILSGKYKILTFFILCLQSSFKSELDFTLYFIIPRTGSSTQLTENRTTLDLSFLIGPDISTNSIVKAFIKQRTY